MNHHLVLYFIFSPLIFAHTRSQCQLKLNNNSNLWVNNAISQITTISHVLRHTQSSPRCKLIYFYPNLYFFVNFILSKWPFFVLLFFTFMSSIFFIPLWRVHHLFINKLCKKGSAFCYCCCVCVGAWKDTESNLL